MSCFRNENANRNKKIFFVVIIDTAIFCRFESFKVEYAIVTDFPYKAHSNPKGLA